MKKFLLLSGVATIAVASTAFAVNYEQATIQANVSFASPSVATKGDNIYFGMLDPAAGGTLTVNPDGTFDGSAKVINNGGVMGTIRSGSIKFSGGRIPLAAGDSYSLDTETDTYTQNLSDWGLAQNDSNQFLVKLALDGARIDMYKIGDSSKPSCGYVDNLTQGEASWDGTYYTLRIGGTLHVDFDENYGDADDTACSGQTTVTYVLQEWF